MGPHPLLLCLSFALPLMVVPGYGCKVIPRPIGNRLVLAYCQMLPVRQSECSWVISFEKIMSKCFSANFEE